MTSAGNQEKYQKSTKLENESTLSCGGQGAFTGSFEKKNTIYDF